MKEYFTIRERIFYCALHLNIPSLYPHPKCNTLAKVFFMLNTLAFIIWLIMRASTMIGTNVLHGFSLKQSLCLFNYNRLSSLSFSPSLEASFLRALCHSSSVYNNKPFDLCRHPQMPIMHLSLTAYHVRIMQANRDVQLTERGYLTDSYLTRSFIFKVGH